MTKVKTIPAMTPPVVHDYLTELGKQWTGQGVAVELGSWLGATAAALLRGLMKAEPAYDRPFYAFDRWKASTGEVVKARSFETISSPGILYFGQDLLPLFLKNVRYSRMRTFQGSIQETITQYPGDPIEICLFDAPKHNPLFIQCIRALSPYWIPGVTVLGLLDYYAYRKRPEKQTLKAPVRLIENNPGCFEKLVEWPDECSCVFFKYVKELR
jgi:hypothetical protein